jgi:hypothetical protein
LVFLRRTVAPVNLVWLAEIGHLLYPRNEILIGCIWDVPHFARHTAMFFLVFFNRRAQGAIDLPVWTVLKSKIGRISGGFGIAVRPMVCY